MNRNVARQFVFVVAIATGLFLPTSSEAFRTIRSSSASAEPACELREARAARAAATNQRICNARAARRSGYRIEDCLARRNAHVARRLERAGCDAERFVRTIGAPVDSATPTLTVCGETFSADGSRRTETYSFGAINEKLAAHPEIARDLRVETVDSCDAARDFLAAYARRSEQEREPESETGTSPESAGPTLGSELGRTQVYLGAETDPDATPDAEKDAIEPASVWLDLGDSRGCSGTFVSSKHVLTAAHCFEKTGRRLLTLKWRKSKTASQPWETPGAYVTQAVSTFVYVYPHWAGNSVSDADSDEDIAIVSIDDPNFYAAPEVLPISIGSLNVGETGFVVGWGAWHDEAQDNLHSRKQRVTGDWLRVSAVRTYAFEARASTLGRHCAGDSGAGWLTTVVNKTNLQVIRVLKGVASAAQKEGHCPEVGKRMTYTRITPFKMDWIERTMRNRFGSSFACKKRNVVTTTGSFSSYTCG